MKSSMRHHEASENNEVFEKHRRLIFFYILVVYCLGLQIYGTAQPAAKVRISEDQLKLMLDDRIILQNDIDGFMSLKQVVYSPAGGYFAVIGCGYECNDNVGFSFKADGTNKRKFTGRWDNILQDLVEWSEDGKKLFYYRINSTGADPPASAPAEGWTAVDIRSGRKSRATTRRLKPNRNYLVIRSIARDGLAIRKNPGISSRRIGTIPSDGSVVEVTGAPRCIGRSLWVPVKYQSISGWVNQSYLRAAPE